jgi:pimeloyl-ACP methyl ester carboxylesterase
MGAWDSTRRVVVQAGRAVGRAAAAAYHAVDPDLRSHLAQLPVIGLTMLAGRSAPPARLPDDGHRPLICVPGLGGGPGNFLPLRLYLRHRGRRRTYAMGFPAGQSLEEMAAHLRAYLAEVLAVNELDGDARVDLVAHSMGGLAARLALEDEAVRARVATLVTLGTPHAGSHLARYGSTARSLDLRPDSAILARLAAQLPWRAPPRLVAVWSPADVILLPATSACVEGAENVEASGFTHYGYVIDPDGWRLIAAKLE